MPEPNKDLYNASFKALSENGVPLELAEKASGIIAKDNPHEPHLGRSQSDQELINNILPYLQGDKND
jgi:hypothetical protein